MSLDQSMNMMSTDNQNIQQNQVELVDDFKKELDNQMQ